jgi:precorrin-8X/cobalt-precorrin-8 methylmutase
MSVQYTRPSEIERASLAIIREELRKAGAALPPEHRPVVERVIHATADFDYAENLVFTENAAAAGIAALGKGADIVTDTNMARAGVSATGLSRLGGEVYCYMADPEIVRIAREDGSTRAAASVRYAARAHPGAVFAVGNAPTALLELERQLENGFRPALIVGVPVGFVNVVEAKERILDCCRALGVPAIVARGRKRGSNVAAAILNALIYAAADMQDPAQRGWN